ncbi:prepilin-type N-terminal cleavage/methylation domain-containing protein [Propionivibrio sp.]|uniref:prepilin-type N-terminal cleavage/methylation domain-containing protein n=1 Tax=Propionivibrio sp. TaxID=2212460 RepID=UPI0026109A26|nr:prepilin-type N-terminal cleavage/methylation domain-containing protein [Propionivibrio sp.]
MRKQQSGFTLVEIAIVLVIIGLLLGGVLKGQELVNNAKVKNLANDFRGISSFVYAYQDRFRALPGDDRAANTHLNGGTNAAAASLGNARIDGAWNSVTATDESYLFWQHVRLAGLATGTTNTAAGDYIPRNAEGGTIGVTSDPILTGPAIPYPASFYVCSQGIQGRFARQIDTTLDDGNTQTGTVRVITDNAANMAEAINVAAANDAVLYTVCMSF